jgi:hypothetical protein
MNELDNSKEFTTIDSLHVLSPSFVNVVNSFDNVLTVSYRFGLDHLEVQWRLVFNTSYRH